MAPEAELLPGTLDLLILKAVSLGAQHGYGVLLRIEQITGGALAIEQGALYPALYRLEHQGLLDTEWGTSDNNRRAKFYTPDGRRSKAAEDRHRTVESHRPGDEHGPARTGGVNAAPALDCARSGATSSTAPTWSETCPTNCSSTSSRRAEDLVERRGLSPDEAMRIARLEFGSVEKYKEAGAARVSASRLVDEVRGDLRYAFRTLRRKQSLHDRGRRDARARHRREHGDLQPDRRGHAPARCR